MKGIAVRDEAPIYIGSHRMDKTHRGSVSAMPPSRSLLRRAYVFPELHCARRFIGPSPSGLLC